MTAAIDGVRVLDFTQMMMGPWATQFLGDLGADVIKVKPPETGEWELGVGPDGIKAERPETGEWERGLRAMGKLLDGDSPFFLAMNRNKKSLTLNLKDPRAQDTVKRLPAPPALLAGNFPPP